MTMKVFNSDNADTIINDYCVLIGDVEEEEVKFENSSIVVGNVKADSILVANHQLIILGDFEANEVQVKEDLICLGSIQVETMEVEGQAKFFSNCVIENLQVAGDLYIENADLTKLSVGGNVWSSKSLFVDEDSFVESTIFCREGLSGSGSGRLKAQAVIVGEYLDMDIDAKLLVNLYEKLEQIKPPSKSDISVKYIEELFLQGLQHGLDYMLNDSEFVYLLVSDQYKYQVEECLLNHFDLLEMEFSYEEISRLLEELGSYSDRLANVSNYIKRVLRLLDFSKIDKLEDYLEYIDLKHNYPQGFEKMSIYKDLFVDYLPKRIDENILYKELRCRNLEDCSQLLRLVNNNRHIFGEELFYYLCEKILNSRRKVDE